MSDKKLSNTDSIFARAYAAAIRDLFNVPISERQAIFVSPVTQRGIPGGDFIYPEMTNYFIKQVGDSLLFANDPSYTGGSAGSYIQQLRGYLANVKTKTDTSQVVQQKMAKASEDINGAQKNFDDVYAAAKKQFTLEKEDYPKLNFTQWAAQYYAPLNAARNTVAGAQAKYFSAAQDYYGPDYAFLTSRVDKMRLAEEGGHQHYPGLTMPVLLEDIDKLADIQHKANTGLSTSPKDITNNLIETAAYTITGGYRSTVQAWIDAAGNSRERKQKITLNIEKGRSTTWEEFGFKKVAANASGGFWPFFSVSVNYDKEKKETALETKDKEDEITIEISMLQLSQFSITPSSQWDIPNIRAQFPELREGSPKFLSSDKARVTSILAAYDVALKVTFGSSLKEKVNKMYEDVEKYGGEINIMGFRVTAKGGAQSDTRVETKFDDVNWDKNTGTITLEPTAGQVYPTILGVIGERFAD